MGTTSATRPDIADRALRAWTTGQALFLWEAPTSGTTTLVAKGLEAIEQVGWRFEAMSHVWRPDRSVGYYLFRRPRGLWRNH